ncbi:MAG TPA: MFS transporter [Solirubrobacteraceae bacterium]|jgi:MFS family permease|nr:MFS transporter [Solirubrobacteraceae bacterium]
MTVTSASSSPARAALRHSVGVWAIAFAFLAVISFNAMPAPLYGLYQQRDGFSSFMLTVIFAAYAVGVVISLLCVGHLSDWHGRRRLFIPALITCMISAGVFLAWRALPGLIVGRFVGGLAVGMVTATATAWIAELHRVARPDASVRRAQVISTTANLGGIGAGPLIAGSLAEWVRSPLTVPFIVALGMMGCALACVLASPETREPVVPRPRWRPQRVAVPAHAVARYIAAGIGAGISFAVFGLFTSLAPTFLGGPLHHHSLALAGATAFAVFAAAVVSQTLIRTQMPRPIIATGIAIMVTGLAVLVVSVWLSAPSLSLFLVGGVITGAGAGALFKGVVAVVALDAPADRRAEALAGMFLAGYIGLSLPVVALGVVTQYLSPRLSLLIFTAALTAGVGIVTPRLLIGGSEATEPAARRRQRPVARAARLRSHASRSTQPSNRSPR